MTTLKTGMKPWSTKEIKLKFHKYLYRQALPYAPKEFGHVHKSAPNGGWGMLANDEIGDCLAGETLVLTADLRWVEIGSLRVGDELVGFDEQASINQRQYRTSIVERVEPMMKPCFDLLFEDGTKIRASFDHQWLRTWLGGVPTRMAPRMWIRTEHMQSRADGYQRPTHLKKCFTPWDIDDSYEAGYLAGALDGEGCYARSERGTAKAIQFSQRLNEMALAVGGLLEDRGFVAALTEQKNSSLSDKGYEVLRVGGRAQVAKLLGSIRPKRLLPKFRPEHLGRMDSDKIALVEKIDAGMQEVVAVQTSTRTFIAEGFASHNCTIAGIMHGQMVWDWATNNDITVFDDDVARKQYFALTGGVDSGLNPVEVASFWKNDGLIDADGKTHKVAAYAAINTPNDLIESAYLFGFSGLGVFLPDNAIPQFIAGKVWDDTTMPMNPQHGHFIPVVGRNSHGNLMVVTWGRLHAITQKWLDRYFAGGVAYISQEYFNKTGVSPEGFNFKQLSDDLTQLGSDNG